MNTTRTSLLLRVKDRGDAEAWSEFHKLYAPVLYRYARGKGLSRQDAEEVRDQCLEVLVRKIPDFHYDRAKGSFKNWLYRIASGKVIDLQRKRRERIAGTDDIDGLHDPSPTPDELWERHWKQERLKYCVEQVKSSVSELDYKAFRLLLREECPVPEVCARLGINANQVYKAKARVIRRVREKLTELEADLGE